MWVKSNCNFRHTKKSSFHLDIKKQISEAQACDFHVEDPRDFFFHEEGREYLKASHLILLQDFIPSHEKQSRKNRKRIIKHQLKWRKKKLKKTEAFEIFKRPSNQQSQVKISNKKQRDEKNVPPKNSQDVDFLNIERTVIENPVTEVHISRMQPRPSGSISIMCEKSRVIILVLWSVHFTKKKRTRFSINVVPIIDCMVDDVEILTKIAISIGNTLTNKFHSHNVNSCFYGNPVELFNELSAFLTSNKSEIVRMLSEKILATHIKEKVYIATLQKSLQESNISPSRSLDYLDIYKKTEKIEMEVILQAEENLDCSLKGKNNVPHCPICFEPFAGNQMHLTACGHQACASCWRGLLQSAASSGDAVVKCPYFRCSNILGIREMAHILFGEFHNSIDIGNMLSTTKILMNLVRFRVEQYLFTSMNHCEKNTSFLFCPTPSCKRIFSFANEECIKEGHTPPLNGSNIFLCICGASICGDCCQIKAKSNDDFDPSISRAPPSHLGLSCAEYKKVRKEIDSGRMNAEFKSLQWMKKNAKPCPKCNFPINKNGGCNHVWCQKCSYYFCWVCKGPGNMCRAYKCNNHVDGQNDMEEIIDTPTLKLPFQVHQFMRLAEAEERYHDTLKRGALINDKDIALELQLYQTTIWLRSYLAAHARNSKSYASKLSNKIVSLEQVADVISMKNHETSERMLSLIKEGKDLHTLDALCSKELLAKVVPKRKKQALKAIKKRRLGKGHNIVTPQKLLLPDLIKILQLFSMEPRRFKSHAQSEIYNAIKQFQEGNIKWTKEPEIETDVDTTDHNERIIEIFPLNKKAKPLRAAWKKTGLSPTDSSEDSGKDIKKHGTLKRDSGKGKMEVWKGKNCVKARRTLASEEFDFIFC